MLFYFFRDQANVSRQKCTSHTELFVGRTGDQVHLNEIGEIDERRPGRAVLEIVQREQIAVRFQATAGSDYFAVDLNGFQDLDDNLILGENCGEFAEQRFARAVNERAATGNQPIDSEKHNAVEG